MQKWMSLFEKLRLLVRIRSGEKTVASTEDELSSVEAEETWFDEPTEIWEGENEDEAQKNTDNGSDNADDLRDDDSRR